ncbi:hypothetical protein XELAEV_18018312mg [Xenopus laevis]|uniref:Uncharacterized protein n=1 Tax=Xenopus laevis TaxID=8355 RepID=A0A974DCR1_XENLA|nr:hypothetical protein XELAEV_18018312mg [Xenopus laevis]
MFIYIFTQNLFILKCLLTKVNNPTLATLYLYLIAYIVFLISYFYLIWDVSSPVISFLNKVPLVWWQCLNLVG